MFRRNSSDLAERLPLYNDMHASVTRSINEGIFEGVDPILADLWSRSTPLALDKKRRIVVPDEYNFMDGPAVLVLGPGETAPIDVRPAAKKAADYVSEVLLEKPVLTHDVEALQLANNVLAGTQNVFIATMFRQHPEIELHTMSAPVAIVLRSDQVSEHCQATTAGHELSHWQNSLLSVEQGPLVHDPIDYMMLGTRDEKAAYLPGYKMLDNAGYAKLLPRPEELAGFVENKTTAAGITQIGSKVFSMMKDEPESMPCVPSLIAAAISIAYGDPHAQSVTSDEHLGYISYGLSQ